MKIAAICLVLSIFLAQTVFASPSRFALKGKLANGANYTVLLVGTDGSARAVKLGANGKFQFRNVHRSFLTGATLQLADPTGSYFGPVVLKRSGSRGHLAFSGRGPKKGSSIDLKTIALGTGAASTTKSPESRVVNRSRVTTLDAEGTPFGGGRSGLVASSVSSMRSDSIEIQTAIAGSGGADSDGDGIVNAFDVDDDGDLILDATDTDSASASARENPFTTLYLGMGQTLNANIETLTSSAIDAVIGGENYFNLIFFLSLTEGSSVTGGHVCSVPPT